MKELVCWVKNKLNTCYMENIIIITDELEVLKERLKIINNYHKSIQECIQKNNTIDIKNFKEGYIKDLHLNKMRDRTISKELKEELIESNYQEKVCTIMPNNCKKEYNQKVLCLMNLKKMIDRDIKLYNSKLTIIKKVQKHLENEPVKEKIYFKFGRDNDNLLIGIYFNIESFIKKIIQDKDETETIYIFSEVGGVPHYKHTVLHLKYKRYESLLDGTDLSEELTKNKGYAHISDFISFNKRKGHGTFVLQNLYEIIKEINAEIEIYKNKVNERSYMLETIKAITGKVYASDEQKEWLVKFYNKNGLTTIGKKWKCDGYVPDSIIFRKLL